MAILSESSLASFIQQHQLPEQFGPYAERWFDPMLRVIAKRIDIKTPFCLGISGSQGSGKSTLADYCCRCLQEAFGYSVASLSIDDIYLTKKEREKLAEQVHPLLQTRGVPGTHDIKLGLTLLDKLLHSSGSIALPVFDKLRDDRSQVVKKCEGPVHAVIFEGWCIGAQAVDEHLLEKPCNDLESESDHDGRWRRYINQQLKSDYRELFALIDYMVMLKAPSFACVKQWRLEQEQKLANLENTNDTDIHVMPAEEIARFIEYYRRITEQLLQDLPARADYLFELDETRSVVQAKSKD